MNSVGKVVAAGEEVSQFKPEDVIFYADDLNRQGTNTEYQLVNERLVGNKPKSLPDTEATALPLTTITAWEILFEHLSIKQQSLDSTDTFNEVILLVGTAGEVGYMLIQITKLKMKSLSRHWEFMGESKFARAMLKADDMNEQSRLLKRVSEWLDLGYIQTTAGANLGTINADNLKAAHETLESRHSIGKIVLDDF
ncbi:hypothetical protein ACFL2V_17510 [Pseudomonadota bacterium]